ncbi:cytochrome P450, partial [Favolaschia claudopus]
IFILLALTYYSLLPLTRRSSFPLPPGLRKFPWEGNLFAVASELPWKIYAKWARELDSDIIHFKHLGESVVVISSLEATENLLRRGTFSDRPHETMTQDLMGWNFNVGMRMHRRLLGKAFAAQEITKYEEREASAVHRLLLHLLEEPDHFSRHFKRMSGELSVSIIYGLESWPECTTYLHLAERAIAAMSRSLLLGQYLVNTFPILKSIPRWFPRWFPGAGFKKKAEEWRPLARDMLEMPFAETQRQMAIGKTLQTSFTTDALHQLHSSPSAKDYSEIDIKNSAASTFLAGADIIAISIENFVLAMLANPAAQKSAQAEIDSVIGKERLPEFADRDRLPYATALLYEVLRWQTAVPLALPRRLAQDEEYRGYTLPAGSRVYANVWAILHDEAAYPDPFAFKPERFLLDGQLNKGAKLPDAAFGFGRRICPGKHLAISMLWIAIVSILASFDVKKATDEDGNVIEPSYEYDAGAISAPLPFKFSIVPRSENTVSLI